MCVNPIRCGSLVFPCGKCDECLISAEYKLGIVGVCNLSKYRNVYSVTLTYDDEHIPLKLRTLFVNYESGSYFLVDDFVVDIDSFRANLLFEPDSLRELWKSRDKDSTLGVVPLSPGYTDENLERLLRDIRYTFDYIGVKDSREIIRDEILSNPMIEAVSFLVPCARISDVQKWLKSFREYYFRRTGVRPDISYSGVAEYGPLRCRPHYHLCIFANDDNANTLGDLLNCFVTGRKYLCVVDVPHWKHGTGVFKSTDLSNTEYARNVAKYTAKYGKKVSKGVHVCEATHIVPSFRRITSKGYFDSLTQFVCNTILRDIPFMNYMDCINDEKDAFLQDVKCMEYAQIIIDRLQQKYSLFGRMVKIPRSCVGDVLTIEYTYKTKCYGYDIEQNKLSYEVLVRRRKKSILWNAVNFIEGYTDVDNTLREIAQMQDEFGFEFGDAFDEVQARKEFSEQSERSNPFRHYNPRYNEHVII